jgi:hypothetical protein
LLLIRRHDQQPGMRTGHFIFWYGFLRIFIDVFREYPTTLLGIATGQCLNIAMTVTGLSLLAWSRRHVPAAPAPAAAAVNAPGGWLPKLAFSALLLFCLTIPSDWTQDVPARYGKRHPGVAHSKLYPPIGGQQ